MTRPRVFVLLVSIPLLLLITAQWMFKINRAYLPKGESPIDFKSFRSTSLNLLELRTIEDWKIENYMVFDGFWLPQEKELVTLALLGAIDMLQTTKSALSGFTASSDLSFQRYFRTGDLATVQSILDRLLIALAAPGTNGLSSCAPINKLLLIYGDYQGQTNCKSGQGTYAYNSAYANPHQDDEVRSYIVFCKSFIDFFKLHIYQADKPNINYVDLSLLEDSLDFADMTKTQAAESGASIVLHELLHWFDLTQPAVPFRIDDLVLVRPDSGLQVDAYGSFYSNKVRLGVWGATEPPTANVDNYVSMVQEIFYQIRGGRPLPWTDSPDMFGRFWSPSA